ncbi:MAG TPA: hypothetical protein DCS42_04380 [Nitrospiraceae bacterium]|nr:hypothetical protein [Nitrospiraceae bacterium]
MKSFAKLLTVVVAAIVFSIGMGAAPAQARDGGLAFNLALDFRTVDTYFVRSPQYFDGSFSLTGLKAEGQFDIRADKLTISPGLGLAYFFSGEYDYTAAGPTTYTGKDATAVEVDLFVQGAYEVAPKISVLGRMGLAYMAIFADEDPFGEAFDVEVTDLYLSIGGQYEISDQLAAALTYRFVMAEVDSYTDYWSAGDASLDSYSNSGFQAKLTFKF